MSEMSQGEGWWQASDGLWYPPESHPDYQSPTPPQPEPPAAPGTVFPSTPAAPLATVGPRGPIGKPRSAGLTILVSIVTFGIWTLVWSFWNGEELKNYRHQGLGGVGYLLLTLFLAPVTMFIMASEVEKLYTDEGRSPRITAIWGLWFLLPLIGNIIWYVRIQSALNDFWQERGGTPSPGLT